MEFFFSNNIQNQIITLDSVESRHCNKVMRHKIGDKISVVDGLGNLYVGDLIFSDKRKCQVRVAEMINNYNKRNHYTHVAISPIKNHDRLEWFVEKSIEIGIDEISFIKCLRTQRKSIKIDRLNKIAKTAMKQSLKAYLPKINDIVKIDDFIIKKKQSINFICHLEDGHKKDIFHYKKTVLKKQKTCFMIGPEGDFTLDEIKLCKNNNFNSITLGESRLRTETAGVVACHLGNLINL